MTAIDFDARARALLASLRTRGCGPECTNATCVRGRDRDLGAIREALRAVALESGDVVQAAHKARSRGAFPRCGGTGVADAAIVLGIERPR